MTTTATVEYGVGVPLRDGTVLRATVWRPAGGDPVPTLLQRLPYDRSGFAHIAALEPLRAVEAGLAVVVQDTRGRFGSDGDFVPFVTEATDGADTIGWIRSQPWSDGHVGTYGASYNGATQLLAATQAPEGLVAMAPHLTTDQYHDVWTYSGGALQLGFLILWIIQSLGPPQVLRMPPGPERDRAEAILAELMDDPHAAYHRLPIDDDDLAFLAPYFREWVRHPTADATWASIDPTQHHAGMDLAGFHLAGWNDLFVDGTLRNYTGLRDHAASSWARENQHLVVGPWSHGNTTDWQGEVWHGFGAAQAALDPTAMHLEFFRAAFERRPAELPRVKLFVQGADRWRDEDDWPLKRATEETLHLRADGPAGGRSANGGLTWSPPASEEPSHRYLADPREPVPTIGGATFLPGLLLGRESAQKDQTPLWHRDDVLVYVSEPLDRDVEVTGTVACELYVATTATDADWVATLMDVHPDGPARGIVSGIQRARYRHGSEASPLVPGEPTSVRVTLGATSQLFRAGHSIGLLLASSSFPRFDRNPQHLIDVHTATAADLHPAEHTVFHDASRPSRLLLPIVGS